MINTNQQRRHFSTNQRRVESAWIWSTGETPRCGTGKRLVLADVGRKWVRVRPAIRPEAHPDRISLSTYKSILLGSAA